jgi:glycosyltransferase involved in cell wall biosynthesis
MNPTTINASGKIVYWTGWLSPKMEGISKEVFGLKEHFHKSIIIGLSRHYWIKASLRQRYAGINVKGYILLRLLAHLMEPKIGLHHIYGGIAEWHFLRAIKNRPVVMTIAVSGTPLELKYYGKVQRFVTHSTSTLAELLRLGVSRESIDVIYPGINLRAHYPFGTNGKKRFRILFATAPTDNQGFFDRGVALLLEIAGMLREVEFDVIWRPWGDATHIVEKQIAEKGLDNVHLHLGLIRNMADMFAKADATIVPFLKSCDMKVCPTSLIESLAYGRPILVSTKVGIADLVDNEECGEVSEPTVTGFCAAIEAMQKKYSLLARNARLCAEKHFSLQNCLMKYEQLYKEVLISTP